MGEFVLTTPAMDTTASNLEVELKLELDPADRPRLLRAAPLQAVKGERRRLVSTYFDTPDGAVRRAGFALRVRRQGARCTQTVKAEAGPAAGLWSRAEWERAVSGDEPVLDGDSGPLLQAIGASSAERLSPAFVSEIERATRQVLVAGADVEVSLDSGAIHAGDARERVCEVELELRGGPPRALFDLARALDGTVPLRLGVRSKAERGYRLIAGVAPGAVKAEPVRLDPDMTAAAAFGVIAHACLRHFRLNETVLLGGYEAEALHQARVALRRLRSALSLFDPLFEGDEDAALLDAQLRRFIAVLGEARNLDVLAARVRPHAGSVLDNARALAREHARAELLSARSRVLMLDLAEWLAVGRWREDPADADTANRPIGAFAAATLDSARKRLGRSGRGLEKLSGRRLHKVRIKAKQARYAAEFFGPLWTAPKARRRLTAWLERIEALQDDLGDLNDLAIGGQILAQLGVEARLQGADDAQLAALREKAHRALRSLMKCRPFWRD